MDHWTDKPNPEFEQWWATKEAEGYQYGREALENVRFGFEGAQERRWRLIETAPKDGSDVLIARLNDSGVIWWSKAQWSRKWSQWRFHGNVFEPSHFLPLPAPPTESNHGT